MVGFLKYARKNLEEIFRRRRRRKEKYIENPGAEGAERKKIQEKSGAEGAGKIWRWKNLEEILKKVRKNLVGFLYS